MNGHDQPLEAIQPEFPGREIYEVITHDTIAIYDPGGARLMNVVYWEPAGVSDGNTTEDTVEFDC